MRFELDLSREDLPTFQHDAEMNADANALSRQIETATLDVRIEWSRWLDGPCVAHYAVEINRSQFATLRFADSGRGVILKFPETAHPLFEQDEDEESHQDILAALSDYRPTGADESSLMLEGLDTPLPAWGSPLPFARENWLIDGTGEESERIYTLANFTDMISSLIVGPGMILRDVLQRFRYLSPFREMPGRNHHPARSPDEFRWSNGMAAWDLLLLKGETLVEKVNAWLTHEERLNAGYRVEVKRYKELEVNGPLMMALTGETVLDDEEWIRDAVRSLPKRRQLLIRDQRRDVELFPQDVGVGISQVVPVLVAALHSQMGIVAIEEPESNIHPAFQVALGDLFISQTREKPDLMFLVETHSEHLMLRFLRRIRETGENELPPGAPSLTPEGIAVYFVEPEEDGPRIHRIRIDRDGDFIDRWPRGFFQERMKELYGS